MRTALALASALWISTAGLAAQDTEVASDPAPDEVEREAVRVYSDAIRDLLGEPGTAYLATRLRGEGVSLIRSELPERVVEELSADGYEMEIGELAENGLWQFPRGGLFMMLGDIQWWPGRKIAEFSIHVGTRSTELQEVAFTFRREGDGWRLIERGPPEN